MKFKWISILPIGLIPLPCISTSCSIGKNQLTTIINIINDNFNTPSINLGKVNSIDEAKNKFINELVKEDDETRLNEILFDLFNFLGANGLTINFDNQINGSLKILPDDYNFIGLYNDKKCVINTQYSYDFIPNSDNFVFMFKGFLNIQMIDDLSINNKKILAKGDMIQFMYDIESWIKVEINAIPKNQDFNVQLQYSYTEPNDIKQTIGFIKLFPLKEVYYPDFAICSIDDVNFTVDKHHILKCNL